MSICYSNILAGTSAIILEGEDNELTEVKFYDKPGIQDLVVFLALRGWQESSPLIFMSLNAEDNIFAVVGGSEVEVLAIMSKELCDLFRDSYSCWFLMYKEVKEMVKKMSAMVFE